MTAPAATVSIRIDGEEIVVPIPRPSITVQQQREPDRSSIVTFSEVADEHEIAGRLRHLAPIAMHHRLVQPMPDERLARDRFGLSSARLVVREKEIDTTAVEIDRGSQLTQGEGAAFDVPPRPPFSPWRIPRRLIRL